MPFITEEIWQHLPGNNEALIVSSWPYFKDEFVFRESEQGIEYIKTAIKAIRNARAEMNIIPSKKSNIIFVTTDDDISKYIEVGKRYFVNLASAEDIKIFDTKDGLGEENISIVLDKCQVFLPLKELIDYDKEIERLEKEKAKLDEEIKRVLGKLSNEGFVKKAPAKVVEEEKGKQIKYEEMLNKVLERLESLKKSK